MITRNFPTSQWTNLTSSSSADVSLTIGAHRCLLHVFAPVNCQAILNLLWKKMSEKLDSPIRTCIEKHFHSIKLMWIKLLNFCFALSEHILHKNAKSEIEITLYHEVVIPQNWRVRGIIIPIAKIQEQFSSSSAAKATGSEKLFSLTASDQNLKTIRKTQYPRDDQVSLFVSCSLYVGLLILCLRWLLKLSIKYSWDDAAPKIISDFPVTFSIQKSYVLVARG